MVVLRSFGLPAHTCVQWGDIMSYQFSVLQKIGDNPPTIDKSIIVDRFVDLTDIGGVSYINNAVLTNPLTGERYNSSTYSVNAAATAALVTNNPVALDIGLPLTATQADPQITDITSGVGWMYRITAYPTPNTTNQITIRFALRWGNNIAWNRAKTITLGTPAKNIVLYFVRINTNNRGDQYGLVMDYPAAEDDNSECILLRTTIWGDQAAPLPVTPTGGQGGNGTRNNRTDVTVNIGYKNSSFLSGILGDGFNMYYVPNYSDLVKACYYSLSGVNNVSDFINNTAALFLSPSTYIVSAVQIPVEPSAFDAGSLRHQIKMGGLINFNVDCYPLGKIWADSPTWTYSFDGMYFDSYMDFEPYTQINLLLPYVGMVPLRPSECIGGSVSVKYRFEALTGKCIAFVYTTDRNRRNTGYYQYSGDAGYSLPWVGNNGGGSQMMHSAASAAISLASGTAGKSTVGDLASTAASFYGSDSRPKMEGGFGVNTGIFGADDIALFITRAQNAMPENYYNLHGYQTATGGTVGDYSGYTEISYIDLEQCPATDAEKAEIESILRGGVYL